MLSHFKLVIWENCKKNKLQKNNSFTFNIELCSKSVGVGLIFSLLKDNWHRGPHFIVILKGNMIVHEVKTKFKISNVIIFHI